MPAATKEAFAKAHPSATATWEKEGANYEVNFKESGTAMSCVITPAGDVLETETDIAVTDLPAPVSAAIAKQYKGSKVKEAATIVKKDGTTVYEAVIKGKDVLYNSDGTLVKAKKETK